MSVDKDKTNIAPVRKSKRKFDAMIRKIDVSSLNNDDIANVILHCAAALNFRKALENSDASLVQSSVGCCYTKAGDDPEVTIWSGGHIVGELPSAAAARAKGIPPCGG